MTPQEIRKIRLKNDYQQMCNIIGEVVSWTPMRGIPPYVEEYKLSVQIRTIINEFPNYRNIHEITLAIPPEYPVKPPIIKMNSKPAPFHPNWFSTGRWCGGYFHLSEGLGDFVIRMLKSLQFDKRINCPSCPANNIAKQWYDISGNQFFFPCDQSILPCPTLAIPNKKSDLENEKLKHIKTGSEDLNNEMDVLEPIKVFICYSRKDAVHLEKLKTGLSPLTRLRKINIWADSSIDAGKEWESEIQINLASANYIICLISDDFISSDYCYEKELKQALDGHRLGKQKIIPIRLRPCRWEILPIGRIQGIPDKWITQYKNVDEAWYNVCTSIEKLLSDF